MVLEGRGGENGIGIEPPQLTGYNVDGLLKCGEGCLPEAEVLNPQVFKGGVDLLAPFVWCEVPHLHGEVHHPHVLARLQELHDGPAASHRIIVGVRGEDKEALPGRYVHDLGAPLGALQPSGYCETIAQLLGNEPQFQLSFLIPHG